MQKNPVENNFLSFIGLSSQSLTGGTEMGNRVEDGQIVAALLGMTPPSGTSSNPLESLFSSDLTTTGPVATSTDKDKVISTELRLASEVFSGYQKEVGLYYMSSYKSYAVMLGIDLLQLIGLLFLENSTYSAYGFPTKGGITDLSLR